MRRERGTVTAELATIAPFGLAFAVLLVWVVTLGLTQVRLTDAAREGARLVARGESTATAETAARDHAPDHATVHVSVEQGVATVRVSTTSRLPVPFFSGIGAKRLSAESTAVMESP